MTSIASIVFAHQGGWDEMLMVLTPIAVFALLLKVANTRANKVRDARAAETEAPDQEDRVEPPTA